MARDSRFVFLASCSVLLFGDWWLVLGVWRLVCGVWCFGARCLMFDAWCLVRGVSEFDILVLCPWCLGVRWFVCCVCCMPLIVCDDVWRCLRFLVYCVLVVFVVCCRLSVVYCWSACFVFVVVSCLFFVGRCSLCVVSCLLLVVC